MSEMSFAQNCGHRQTGQSIYQDRFFILLADGPCSCSYLCVDPDKEYVASVERAA